MQDERIERILVATDGSPDSARAAAYAARLAAGLGASATIVHVAPVAEISLGTTQLGADLPDPGPEDEVPMAKAIWEGAQQIIDLAAKPFDAMGVPFDGLVQEGDAAEEILKLDGEGSYDLLVLGRRGIGATDESMGSTAAKVILEATRAVLFVGTPHPGGRRGALPQGGPRLPRL